MAKLLNNNTITTKTPASLLMLHQDVTIIMDEEAASGIKTYNMREDSYAGHMKLPDITILYNRY